MHGGKRQGAGRPKGAGDKSLVDARAALALFVQGNVYRLQTWLDQIANGVREPDKPPTDENPDGEPGEWAVYPNPLKAFEMVHSIIEFHVPKLGRIEHTGKDGEALPPMRVEFIENAPVRAIEKK